MEVCSTSHESENGSGSDCSRDKLLQNVWRSRGGVFLASVKEAKMTLADVHSNGALAVLVVSLVEKGNRISVLEKTGTAARRAARFPASAGGCARQVRECSWNSERYRNDTNC